MKTHLIVIYILISVWVLPHTNFALAQGHSTSDITASQSINSINDIATYSDDVAKLSIHQNQGNAQNFDVALLPTQTSDNDDDPLLCRRIKNRISHMAQLNREITNLVEKINASGRPARDSELQELAALEKRRDVHLVELNQPAPTMTATWTLNSVDAEVIDKIMAEQIHFRVQSFAFDWEDEGSFYTPDRLHILTNRLEKTLTLVIKSNLGSYCSDRRWAQFEIWLL